MLNDGRIEIGPQLYAEDFSQDFYMQVTLAMVKSDGKRKYLATDSCYRYKFTYLTLLRNEIITKSGQKLMRYGHLMMFPVC